MDSMVGRNAPLANTVHSGNERQAKHRIVRPHRDRLGHLAHRARANRRLWAATSWC